MPDYTLHHGDCLEVMKAIPDGSVDLTVTSPPYDNLRTYNGYTFDFEGIARELYRVTKPGGVVVWVVGDATIKGSETGTSFRQALYFKDVCGFNLHDTMIYEKQNPIPLSHNRYEQHHEFMFVLSKGRPKQFSPLRVKKRTSAKPGKFWQRGSDKATSDSHAGASQSAEKIAPNIWRYPVGGGKSGHPAPFPEQLASDHIASWSNPGDVVLDPFLGSGTTGKMALLAGRKFIGIEISEEYLAIASERIVQAHPSVNLPCK